MKNLNAVKFKDVNSFNKNKTKANVKRYIEGKKIIVFEDGAQVTPNRAKVSHVFKVDDIDRIPSNEGLISINNDYKKGIDHIKNQGLRIKREFPRLGIVLIDLPEHTPYEETRKKIGRSRDIKSIEQDYIVTHTVSAVDFTYNDTWQLPAMRCQEAWALIPPGPDNYVAVFDLRCETLHPDLLGQTFDNYNHWTGTPDVEPPPTFNDPATNHGTPCSGIICANPSNGTDTIGVAGPRTKVTFQGIGQPLGGGYFTTSNAVQVDAIDYVSANPLCVAISMSYGCGGCSCPTIPPGDIRQTALERARIYGRGGDFSNSTPGLGVLSFASSGNGSALNCGELPAWYPVVVSVGATDINGQRASFSNYGTKLDFAAPGVAVPCTDRTGSNGYNLLLNNIIYSTSDTCTPNGTSFSCPIAAGLAGAIAAANDTLSADQILDIMKLTCNKTGPYNYFYDPSTPDKSLELGYGQIDFYAAVSLATSGTIPPGPIVLPDLRVVINSPTTVNQGDDMTISYTLSLNTIAVTDITFDVKVFYSLDGTYDPSDPELITKPETITQGTFFKQGSHTFTVPNTLSGDVWFGVFADSTNVIDPEPELNNVGIRKTFVQGVVVPVGLNLAVEIDSLNVDSVTGIALVRYRLTNTGAITVTNFRLRKGFDGLNKYEYLLYRTLKSEDRLEFEIPWTDIPDPNDLFTTPYRIEILAVNGIADDVPGDDIAVILPDIAVPSVINI
jgi:hypothetical protein